MKLVLKEMGGGRENELQLYKGIGFYEKDWA